MKINSRIFLAVLFLAGIGAGAYVLFSKPADNNGPSTTTTAIERDTTSKPSLSEPANSSDLEKEKTEPREPSAAREKVTNSKAESVTGIISGKVIRSSNQPIEGVKVKVFALDSELLAKNLKGAFSSIAETTTDAEGNYRFNRNLITADRSLTLRFEKLGYAPSAKSEAFQFGVNQELAPVTLLREASITGWVQGAPKENPELIKVWSVRIETKSITETIMDLSGKEIENLGEPIHADGSFKIGGLAPGKYQLFALATGFYSRYSEVIELKEEESRTGITLPLEKGLSISGRVLSPEGNPVASAKVQAMLMPDLQDVNDMLSDGFGKMMGKTAAGQKSAKSDANGFYLITGLEAKGYRMQVESGDFILSQKNKVDAGSANVDFAMSYGGVIKGIVLDRKTLQPVSNCEVSKQDKFARSTGMKIGNLKQGEIKTAQDGSFSLKQLTPQNYSLSFSKKGYAPTQKADVVMKSDEVIDLGQVLLGQGGTIKIICTDEGTGSPVENAVIKLVDPQKQKQNRMVRGLAKKSPLMGMFGEMNKAELQSTNTDSAGVANLSLLAPGTHTFEITHSEHYAINTSTEVREDETIELKFSLQRGGSICGKSLNDKGAFASLDLQLLGPGKTGNLLTAKSDDKGEFCFKQLAPGDYWIRVDEEDDFDLTAMVPNDKIEPKGLKLFVKTSETLNVDLQQTARGSLSGRVAVANAPVEKIQIQLIRDGSPDIEIPFFNTKKITALSAADGSYQIDGILPGKFKIAAFKEKIRLPLEIPVEIHSGNNTKDVLLSGGKVEGQLTDQNGAPLSGRPVRLDKVQGESKDQGNLTISFGGSELEGLFDDKKSKKTNAEGKFVFDFLPPGDYVARFTGDKSFASTESAIISLGENESKTGIELRVSVGGNLHGKVYKNSEDDLAELFQIVSEDGKTKNSVFSDSNGEISVKALKPGKYHIETFEIEVENQSKKVKQEFIIEAGKTTEIEIHMNE